MQALTKKLYLEKQKFSLLLEMQCTFQAFHTSVELTNPPNPNNSLRLELLINLKEQRHHTLRRTSPSCLVRYADPCQYEMVTHTWSSHGAQSQIHLG